MIFTTSSGQRLATDNLLGKGGEGEVWAIQGDGSQVAKIYHPKNRQPEREAKIQAMVANPPKDETRTLTPPHVSLAWPTAPLYDQGTFVGYLMPRIEHSPNIFQVYNPVARAKTSLAHFDRRYLHRVAQNFAIALHALHEKGDVMGDVNQQNVLVTDRALVTLVDTDSFQIQAGGRTFRCPVGVADYTPPELHGLKLDTLDRVVEHDRFGLAVLIFQLLMNGVHPFTGAPKDPNFSVEGTIYQYAIRQGLFPYQDNPTLAPPPTAPHFTVLHPELQGLLNRCFIAGHRQPALRPTTKEWIASLARAEGALVRCQRDTHHWYGDHLARCPWCDPPGTVPTLRTPAVAFTQQPLPGLARSGRTAPPSVNDLSSEKGIDYTHLRDLLKAGKWREADRETYDVMIRAVGKESGDWFTREELLNFPCTDLHTIDGLWVTYSQGQFGFSVQKRIYVECGAKLDGKYPGDTIWREFGNRVGWRKGDSLVDYKDLKANPSFSPAGEFPSLRVWFGVGGGWYVGWFWVWFLGLVFGFGLGGWLVGGLVVGVGVVGVWWVVWVVRGIWGGWGMICLFSRTDL